MYNQIKQTHLKRKTKQKTKKLSTCFLQFAKFGDAKATRGVKAFRCFLFLFYFVFCFVFVRYATANIMASKKCGLYFCRFKRLILRLQMSPVLTAAKKRNKEKKKEEASTANEALCRACQTFCSYNREIVVVTGNGRDAEWPGGHAADKTESLRARCGQAQ